LLWGTPPPCFTPLPPTPFPHPLFMLLSSTRTAPSYATYAQQLHLAAFDALPPLRLEVLLQCLAAMEAADVQEDASWAHALFTLLCHGRGHFGADAALTRAVCTWLQHSQLHSLPPSTVLNLVELAVGIPGGCA
jgi:hypothetical protein